MCIFHVPGRENIYGAAARTNGGCVNVCLNCCFFRESYVYIHIFPFIK